MRQAYLFVYNSKVGTREQVKNVVDSLPEIINWRSELPSSYFLIPEKSANELACLIRQRTGKKGAFIITEVGTNQQGWLDPEGWHFLNHKPDVGG